MKTFLTLSLISFVSLAIFVILSDTFGNVGVVLTMPSIVILYVIMHYSQVKSDIKNRNFI